MSRLLKLNESGNSIETPEKGPNELFDASPLPHDGFATPALNKTARGVFRAPPGEIRTIVTETEEVTVNDDSFADVPLTPEATTILQSEPVASENNGENLAKPNEGSRNTTPRNAAQVSPSGPGSATKPTFNAGDVVWAQTDVQFPFWAGLVVDVSHLPVELQQPFQTTARNGKSNKVPVYFYARNDYDLVAPQRMKDFEPNLAAMKDQLQVSGALYLTFNKGIRAAKEDLKKEPLARLERVANQRSDAPTREASVGRNGSLSNLSSRSSSRASSMQINTTESTDGVHVGAGPISATAAAAQGQGHIASPQSGNVTPLSTLTIGSSVDSARFPSRFTFPDHALPSQTQTSLHLEPVPENGSIGADSEKSVCPNSVSEDPSLSTHATSFALADEVATPVEHAPPPTSVGSGIALEPENDATPQSETSFTEAIAAETVPDGGAAAAVDATSATQTFLVPPLGETLATERSTLGADNYEIVDLHSEPPTSARSAVAPHGEHDIRERLDSLAFSNAASQFSSDVFSQLEDEHDSFAGPAGNSFELSPFDGGTRSPPTVDTGLPYIGAADALTPPKPRTPPRETLGNSMVSSPHGDYAAERPGADLVMTPFSTPGKTASTPPSAGPSVTVATPEATLSAVAGSAHTSPVRPEVPPACAPSPKLTTGDLFAAAPGPPPGPPQLPPTKSFSDAASLFGGAPLSMAPRPPSVPRTDASSLFGGSAAPGPFGAPVTATIEASAPSGGERVRSGGRAAVVNVDGRGLFDNAPAPVDGLFGSSTAPPPSTTASVKRAPRVVATAAASDLFGSAPHDATPFGAPPIGAGSAFPPPPTASGLFGAPPPSNARTAPSAADLFGGPPAPSVHTTVPPRTTADLFAAPPPSATTAATYTAPHAPPAASSSPHRGGTGTNAGDAASLFGSSANADEMFGPPAPPLPAPPTLRVPARTTAAPPKHGADALFGAPPPAPAATTAPPVDTSAAFASVSAPSAADIFKSAGTARDLFGPPPTAVTTVPPVVDAGPTPFSAQESSYEVVSSGGGDTSGELVSPASEAFTADAIAGPATTTQTHAPAISAEEAFGASAVDSAADVFGTDPVAPPAPFAPEPQVVAPLTATESFPAAPLPAHRSSTVAVAAPATNAAQASASGTAQTELRRTASSGPVFVGRPKIVSGASPFDAVGPENTADKLFAAPAAGPFDAPGAAGSLFGAPAAAGADLFGAGPPQVANAFPSASSTRASSTSGSSVDLFAAPPPGGTSPFGIAPPGSATPSAPGSVTKAKAKGHKATLSASDVFNSAAPVEKPAYAPLADPFTPPPPPGVKVAPKQPPTSVTGMSAPVGGGHGGDAAHSSVTSVPLTLGHPPGTLPSPVPGASSPLPPGSTEVAPVPASTVPVRGKPPPAKTKKAPPPGMMATPHGYVPIPSAQPLNPAPATTAPAGTSVSKPLVNHSVLTSLVTEVPPEVVAAEAHSSAAPPDAAATAHSAFDGPPAAATSTTATVTAAAPRGRYTKPPAAVVSFGFGGKVLTTFPREQRNSMPVFNPAYGVPNLPAPAAGNGPVFRNGPVRIRTLYEVIRSAPERNNSPEMQELVRLLTLFPGPLTNSATADTGVNGATTALVHEELQRRIDHPLSTVVNSSKTVAGPAESEKLLWALLKLCVDRGGVLSSDAGEGNDASGVGSASDAISTEMKIAQLLMGHAPSDTAAVPGATGNVKVFSGSAASIATSYAPDMTKSKELHAAFAPPKTSTPSTTLTAERCVEIEALLVVGRKEDALRKAIQYGEWSLALLIGSVCGAEKYQEVIRSYSAAHFPAAAPLHLLTLLYANQGTTAVLSTAKTDDALTMWRHNLSAILSNKTSNWQQLATFLGYRLLNENKDIFAAHSTYLCAGAFPTFPSTSASSSSSTSTAGGLRHSGGASTFSSNDSLHGQETRSSAAELETQATKQAGKYTLLGCDVTQARHKAMMDCLSISALRGTEILEYTLHKRLAAQVAAASMTQSPSVDGIASFGKSLTDMFSWKGGAAGGETKVPPKSPRQPGPSASSANTAGAAGAAGDKQQAQAAASNVSMALRYRVTKVKAVLCPLKVRFAMVLADFGLTKEAMAYAMDAKNCVNEIGVSEEKKRPPSPKGSSASAAAGGKPRSNSGSSSNEWGVRSFNRSFVRALEEFVDRLHGGRSSAPPAAGSAGNGSAHRRDMSAGTTGSASSTGSSGIWGNVFSSINLKELVDGMTEHPGAASGAALGPPPTGGPHKSVQHAPMGPPPTGPVPGSGPVPPTAPPAHNAPSASTPWPSAPPTMPGVSAAPQQPSKQETPATEAFAQPPPQAHSHGVTPPLPSARHSGQRPPVPPASYAPMSSVPPRPGGMAVPPPSVAGGSPAHLGFGGPSGPFGSPAPVDAGAHAQGGGNPEASGFFDVDLGGSAGHGGHGGSDFFDQSGYTAHAAAGQHPGYNAPPTTHSAPYAQPPAPGPYGGPPAHQPQHQHAAPAPHAGFGGPVPSGGHAAENKLPSQGHSASPDRSAPPASIVGSLFGFGASGGGTSSTTGQPPAPAPTPAAPASAPVPPAPKPAASAAPPASSRSAAAPASTAGADAGGKGLMGIMQKSLLKFMYPDAHDASDNIGKSLEAVFNKETGRWEFPGEENSAPSPASLPPPTGPIGGSGNSSGMNSLGVSPSPSVSAFGSANAPPSTMGGSAAGLSSNASSDPLAALMAPPSRRMPTSYSTPNMTDGDPLAALMAPPSMRYSMPSASTASTTSLPPAINVWRPPVVAAAVAAPAPHPAESNSSGPADGSHGAISDAHLNNGPPLG